MLTKFSAVHAKALLFIVALVACSTTSVATAASRPEDMLRSLRAEDTWNTIYTPLSTKRNLRSDAIRTTSDNITGPEKLVKKVFKNLMLNRIKDGDKLFNDEKFLNWYTFWKDKVFDDSSVVKTGSHAMLVTLEGHYGLSNAKAVAEFLMARLSTEGQASTIASELMEFQDLAWIKHKGTPEMMFDIFQLDQLKAKSNKIFEEPVMGRWINFVITYEKHQESGKDQRVDPSEKIYAVLSKKYDVKILANALIAAPRDIVWNSIVPLLLERQLKEWRDTGKSTLYAYLMLRPYEPNSAWVISSFLSTWLDYIRLLGANDSQVYNVLADKFSLDTVNILLESKIPDDPLQDWKIRFKKVTSTKLQTDGVISSELAKKIWGRKPHSLRAGPETSK